jgi:uncharacterized membrane protein
MGTAVGRLRGALRSPGVRGVLLVVLAYCTALASILSFMFVNAGSEPTRVELGLLLVTVVLVFYVSLTAG